MDANYSVLFTLHLLKDLQDEGDEGTFAQTLSLLFDRVRERIPPPERMLNHEMVLKLYFDYAGDLGKALEHVKSVLEKYSPPKEHSQQLTEMYERLNRQRAALAALSQLLKG